MKGQILDIYPEGKPTYRACVIELVADGLVEGEEAVKVVNLGTGENNIVGHYECELPIIENIFKI